MIFSVLQERNMLRKKNFTFRIIEQLIEIRDCIKQEAQDMSFALEVTPLGLTNQQIHDYAEFVRDVMNRDGVVTFNAVFGINKPSWITY